MTFDSRWKLPQAKTPEALYDSIFSLVRELRKGDLAIAADGVSYDNATSGLVADDVQAAIDEVEGRVDTIEAGGLVSIQSGSLTGATVVITDISQRFKALLLRVTGMSFDADAQSPLFQVSSDNGSSYDTTAGNYNILNAFTGSASAASLMVPFNHALAAGTSDHSLLIYGYQAGAYTVADHRANLVGVGFGAGWSTYNASTDAIDALRFAVSGGGSYDAGTYELFGLL